MKFVVRATNFICVVVKYNHYRNLDFCVGKVQKMRGTLNYIDDA